MVMIAPVKFTFAGSHKAIQKAKKNGCNTELTRAEFNATSFNAVIQDIVSQ